MEEITVTITKYPDRKNLVMRYVDPATGKQVGRTTGTTKRRDAERIGAKWEAELREGRYQKPSKWSWEEFRDYHSEHVLEGMKQNTAQTYETSLRVFESMAKPKRLADVTTGRVTAFATAFRAKGRSPATVAKHLRHLNVVLRWAYRQGLLNSLPTIEPYKHQKGMRGRPITLEEFERMLAKVSSEVEEIAAPSWKFYLWGLWHSGLRLAETLMLRWDDHPGAIVVELGGRRPMLRIPAESEKGGTHRLLPITPEFFELLDKVPESARRGWVFNPLNKSGVPYARTRHNIGPVVSAIGKAANVVTNQRDRDGETVPEFASAHDLRRAFGTRWSRKVMPTVLRELMRHESIETTMKYYVGVNAEATADELWNAVGNISGNIRPETKKKTRVEST